MTTLLYLAYITRQGDTKDKFLRFQEWVMITLWESGLGRGKFSSNPPMLELVECA